MKYKVGDIFYILKGPGKPYKAHIVAIVENDMVVFKWYGRHKQWWHYEVLHEEQIDFWIRNVQTQ